ncbi:hypothetical protein A2803_00270 [Candidatus Woesebacteria bacterium RIFCSPHIGHO2_01_FULL_44_21]|uniref:Uncharacterized protein n=1 Tax=Candidatus Woesebacteria bacterium RIFCSPHIGHO2_01_FULL_44_21 TaxID=1802503 RepID=A0A1F7Z0G6_9BACT|nr:MAG: hypothetical protein A2803_00270 [Candidatus Woesebacteria bacterium RIFCSPHIGHO2_01_FULL_44_21]OGM70587.1 MAG: hypothetical protein A2897_02165 [Candidatus Woesebacteria bacterium RIFCSPLOWO2_01_FULL_44_24b]
MKWVTTNIRFPEDMYMELKMEAAQKRSSMADVIRKKVATKKLVKKRKNVNKLLKEMDEIAKEISRQNPGVSLSEKLIEMRYEQ